MSQDTAHVLVVPNRSIQRDGKTGKTFVFTLDENQKLARRSVVCGITNGELTEIVEGLSKGDAAIVADPSGYTEGMKVGVTKYDF
jgi:multidrug efflux pump subunit AcrA (membrane-fusion protein)